MDQAWAKGAGADEGINNIYDLMHIIYLLVWLILYESGRIDGWIQAMDQKAIEEVMDGKLAMYHEQWKECGTAKRVYARQCLSIKQVNTQWTSMCAWVANRSEVWLRWTDKVHSTYSVQ